MSVIDPTKDKLAYFKDNIQTAEDQVWTCENAWGILTSNNVNNWCDFIGRFWCKSILLQSPRRIFQAKSATNIRRYRCRWGNDWERNGWNVDGSEGSNGQLLSIQYEANLHIYVCIEWEFVCILYEELLDILYNGVKLVVLDVFTRDSNNWMFFNSGWWRCRRRYLWHSAISWFQQC